MGVCSIGLERNGIHPSCSLFTTVLISAQVTRGSSKLRAHVLSCAGSMSSHEGDVCDLALLWSHSEPAKYDPGSVP